MKRLSAILCLVLLLCACAAVPNETTLPPKTTEPAVVTSSPIETTVPPETTAPVAAGMTVAQAASLLDSSAEPNWLFRSLGCLYEHPYELDLNVMFYLGVGHPGSWSDISEESRQTLLDAGFIDWMDIQIMPVEKLEDALQETFGISLDSVAIPESWGYIEKENAYCSNHNDAYFPGVPTISAVEDDGTYITIHYTLEDFWISATGDFLDTAPLVLSLIRNDDGTIHAVSNLLES